MCVPACRRVAWGVEAAPQRGHLHTSVRTDSSREALAADSCSASSLGSHNCTRQCRRRLKGQHVCCWPLQQGSARDAMRAMQALGAAKRTARLPPPCVIGRQSWYR